MIFRRSASECTHARGRRRVGFLKRNIAYAKRAARRPGGVMIFFRYSSSGEASCRPDKFAFPRASTARSMRGWFASECSHPRAYVGAVPMTGDDDGTISDTVDTASSVRDAPVRKASLAPVVLRRVAATMFANDGRGGETRSEGHATSRAGKNGGRVEKRREGSPRDTRTDLSGT